MRTWARNAAPAFLALYLISNLLLRSFTDVWLFIGWASLCSGIILGGCSMGPKRALYALIALLVFHALAIPGSILLGSGNWELTAGVLLWMAPALLLYLAKNAERVFIWLVPAFVIHAGLIIWQGVTDWGVVGEITKWYGSPVGLSNNSNIAAGFLAVGVVYLLTTPLKWLSVPLLVALLFTESRWGLIVMAAVLLAMMMSRTISWRPLAATCAVVLTSVMFLGLFTPLGYTVAGINSFAGVTHAITADVGVRLAVPHIPSFLPGGVAEHPGLHNVPLRIAVENGILAAMVWLFITGWALISPIGRVQRFITQDGQHRGPNSDNYDRPSERNPNGIIPVIPDDMPDVPPQQKNGHGWVLLTLVLLSVLDYYTWMGHLGGFWWLLIGLLLKPNMVGDHFVHTPTSDTPPPRFVKNPMQPAPVALTTEVELFDVES